MWLQYFLRTVIKSLTYTTSSMVIKEIFNSIRNKKYHNNSKYKQTKGKEWHY